MPSHTTLCSRLLVVASLLLCTSLSAQVAFEPAVDYGAGDGPRSVAVGDFDGVNGPDLVVGNYYDSTVSVLLNDGDGAFAAAVNYGTANLPSSVAVGNFDGMNGTDLAVASTTGGTAVSVLLNDGDGTFAAAVNYGTGDLPRSVALGDFDGLNGPDLVVGNSFGDNVLVLLNDDDGAFAAEQDYGVGDDPRSVAVGDFDGLNGPDLAVVNRADDTMSVLLNNGDGTFAAAVNYGTGDRPISVAVGDFDGVNGPDLAVANYGDNTVSLLLNNGNGTFAAAVDYGAGGFLTWVAAGDFDGLNGPDLVIANGTGTVSVLLNDGDGTFAAAVNYGAGNFPASVAVGDFDGLNGPDLVVANENSDNVSVILQAAPPAFSKAFAPDVLVSGATSTLSFTIDNSGSGVAATALDFTDTLPAGVSVANPANAATTCTGGAITATAGTGVISYTGGTASAGASCTVSVDITSATLGNHANTSGDLTSSHGNSGTASGTLTVVQPPAFSKAFAPDSIAGGATSTLTFSIDNSANVLAATALDFTDTLPAGVTVANPANAATTCTGGTLTATPGAGAINYTGGSVGIGASCTVSADVTGSVAGALVNTSGDLTSSSGNSGTAADTLTVILPPVFSKVFAPDSIIVGEISSITFSIDNSANVVAATALDFTDTLPAGITVANPANAATTCTGGAITATAGTGVVSYTGGSVGIGASCTVSADITSATAGSHINTSGDLTSSSGNSGTATDTLTVSNIVVVAPDPVPVVSNNSGLSVATGASKTIGATQLRAFDFVASSANELTFTLQSPPAHGILILDGVLLSTGDKFTQQQINTGQLSYVHGGGYDTMDSFTFAVSNAFTSSDSSVLQVVVAPPDFCVDGYPLDAIIDPGTNLNCRFDPQPWVEQAAILALELSRSLYADGGESLLASLQALSELSDFELGQEPLTRELIVTGPDLLARLLPVAIYQADGAALTDGIYEAGKLFLVTAEGQRVEFLSLVYELESLRDSLGELNLALEFDGAGNLLIGGDDFEEYYIARPGLVAVPAGDILAPGLHVTQANQFSGLPIVILVFPDGEGTLWQQSLLPVPADWEAMLAAILALPGVDAATLDETGIIRVQSGDALFRIVPDYLVQSDSSNPEDNFEANSDDIALIGTLGDSNGDGVTDLLVHYPDGKSQRYHVLP